MIGVDDEGTSVTDTDDATVTITGVPPTVVIVKTATPTSLPEPGGTFTFNFVVTNNSPETVTITQLTDDVYGNLNGRGTCAIGAVLAPGGTYSCSFSVTFTGPPGASQTDIVTVRVIDDDGEQAIDTDDAIITITDIPPVITLQKTATPLVRNEPGGSFTFDVLITNTGTETVTITELTDNIYGNLNGRGTCAIGAVIAPGGTYRCQFTGDFFGNAGASQTDIVTATGVDNDGTRTTARDDAIVRLVDVPPTITLTKDADPASRPDPGGSFTFFVTIVNTSPESVTVIAITDDVYGNLNGRGTCAVGAVIAPGGSYRCQFTVDYRGPGGSSQVDRVTATVVDNDGTRASATDDARISITPVGTPIVVQPVVQQPAPIAPQQLSRTGTDVDGPARLAFAFLLAGMLMVGATWRSTRRPGLAFAGGRGVATSTWFTRTDPAGTAPPLVGGGGTMPTWTRRRPAPPEEIVDPVDTSLVERPTDAVVEVPVDEPVVEPADVEVDSLVADDDLGSGDLGSGDDSDDDTDPDGPPSGGSGPGGSRPSAPGPMGSGSGGAVALQSGTDSVTGGSDATVSVADPADLGPAEPPPAPDTQSAATPVAPTDTSLTAVAADETPAPTSRPAVSLSRMVLTAVVVAAVSHATGASVGRRWTAGRRIH